MKRKYASFLVLSFFALTLGLQGCAADSADRTSTADSTMALAFWFGMGEKSDLVFQYRQRAVDLRDMARRLEMEAAFLSERHEAEQANQTWELAKYVRAAADRADEQAREYRSHVPHNRID